MEESGESKEEKIARLEEEKAALLVEHEKQKK